MKLDTESVIPDPDPGPAWWQNFGRLNYLEHIDSSNQKIYWLLPAPIILKPLQNCYFSVMRCQASNFNPRNTQCIPPAKIFAFLAWRKNVTFFKGPILFGYWRGGRAAEGSALEKRYPVNTGSWVRTPPSPPQIEDWWLMIEGILSRLPRLSKSMKGRRALSRARYGGQVIL